jgi:N-acyl-L-homoserine lactone synthetase
MIDVVLPENRFAFASALLQMHHDRKRVFVDRLGWNLPSRESWLEVDEFDNEYAVYLIARARSTDRHQGSVRLLPSTRPHVLGTLFPSLCANGVPVSERCWEISRFVAPPTEKSGTAVVRVHRMLALALVEFASLNDIETYTLVTESHRVPALLSVGWEVRPLGLPASCNGQSLHALQIFVHADSLALMRSRHGIEGSVLRPMSSQLRAA